MDQFTNYRPATIALIRYVEQKTGCKLTRNYVDKINKETKQLQRTVSDLRINGKPATLDHPFIKALRDRAFETNLVFQTNIQRTAGLIDTDCRVINSVYHQCDMTKGKKTNKIAIRQTLGNPESLTLEIEPHIVKTYLTDRVQMVSCKAIAKEEGNISPKRVDTIVQRNNYNKTCDVQTWQEFTPNTDLSDITIEVLSAKFLRVRSDVDSSNFDYSLKCIQRKVILSEPKNKRGYAIKTISGSSWVNLSTGHTVQAHSKYPYMEPEKFENLISLIYRNDPLFEFVDRSTYRLSN